MSSSLRRNHFIVPFTWHLFVFAVTILCACNSTNQATTTPNKKPETKLVLPQQQITTPANINFVYDYEDIFTTAEEKKLDSLVRIFEKSNLISIKITTVNDPAVTAGNFDENNKTLLKEWVATHGKSDKCMSISISKNQHRISINYGPFVAHLLNDNETKNIIANQFQPSFAQGQWFSGTYNGLTAIMDTIRKNIRF